MKKDIHPEYKEVVFQDVQSDFKFLTRSTMSSDEKIKWEDGKEYPLIKVEVSSASHPFYTGKKIFVDTAGRVEKFNQKYKSKQQKKTEDKDLVSKEETVNQNLVSEEVKAEESKEEVKAEEPKEEVKAEEPKEEVKAEEPKEEVKAEEPKEDIEKDSSDGDKKEN